MDEDLELDTEEDGKPDPVEEGSQGLREVLLEVVDMLSYNKPLKDRRALAVFQSSVSGVKRLHSLIKDKERRTNSTTTPTPVTWAPQYAGVMPVQTRPNPRIQRVLNDIRSSLL